MKLLLTSSGFTNKTIIDAFLKLLTKPIQETKLVFITTPSNVETGGKEWLIKDLWNTLQLGFKKIEITDFAAVEKNIWLPQVEEADVIMVSGGNARYLMDQLNKSELARMLPELLKTRVYVGISAGSMVLGNDLLLTSDAVLYYEDTGKFKGYKSLGFVNLLIRPHFNSPSFPMVTEKILSEMTNKISEPVYALDDNSAVVVNGEEIKVVSEGNWKKFN